MKPGATNHSVEEILTSLTLNMARAVVLHQDRVRVEAVSGTWLIFLELRVDVRDMGRVIGPQGQMAKAMRTLLYAAAQVNGERVRLEISSL